MLKASLGWLEKKLGYVEKVVAKESSTLHEPTGKIPSQTRGCGKVN
jgi:hypothetical protein